MKKILNTENVVAYSVALLTFLVYMPALQNDFVNWDDDDYVYENPSIQSFDIKLVRWAFFGFHAANWHPLTWISHAADYAVWGLNPSGHHLTNIFLHAINTLVVVFLAMMLVDMFQKKSRRKKSSDFFPNENPKLVVGAVTGLLFGIHPLHVESVAWIAERKDVLCALFFLLSVRSYLRFTIAEGNESPIQRNILSSFLDRRYLCALGFFLLAVLSKPMAVTLPLVLLIVDWCPGGRIRSLRSLRYGIAEKVPFFVLSVFSSVLTLLAQSSGKAIMPLDIKPLSVRVIMSARALVSYLSKMLFPVDLVPFYPYPKDVSLLYPEYLLPVLLVIVYTTVCIIVAKRQKLLLAVWSYYVITLLPVLGIIQVGAQSMADRYTYLPSIGPFIVVGLGAGSLIEKVSSLSPSKQTAKVTFLIMGSIVILFLSYESVKQLSIWKNSIVLWNYVVEKEPNEVTPAYYNLGLAYGRKGQTDKAIEDFSKALLINPKLDMAYNNRGTAYYLQGQYDKAFGDFSSAIKLNPNNAEAYINRGYVYLKKGDTASAAYDLQRGCHLGNERGCEALRDLLK